MEDCNESLIDAIESDDQDAVARILAAGADPNQIYGTIGTTPLILAIYRRNDEIVNRLLDHGADIKRSFGGLVFASQDSEYAMDFLLKHIPDWNALDDKGNELYLGMVFEYCPMDGGEEAIKKHFDRLVEHGANLLARDKEGFTLLTSLAAMGRAATTIEARMIKYFLNMGLEPDLPAFDGRNALVPALLDSTHETFELFVEHGFYLDLRDNDGYTCLHYAAKVLNPKILPRMKLLLDKGSSIEAMTPSRKNTFSLVIERLIEFNYPLDLTLDKLRILLDHGQKLDSVICIGDKRIMIKDLARDSIIPDAIARLVNSVVSTHDSDL